ncbi:MAG TPA: glycosyltransferase [Vicinamibacterales bacterium]|nr:glycosyltransferase [Vicinamibacterales bacterium]
MSPVQILYLNPTAQLGGAEYSLLDLAGSLDRGRFVPLIACLGDGPLMQAAQARGIEAMPLELPSRFARLSLKGRRSGPVALAASAMSAAPVAWRIRRLASRAGIVHTNGNKAHVLGGLVNGRARLVWHVRDFWRGGAVERGMVRLANTRVDAVIANSAAVGGHLTRMGVSAPLVQAVPNGIDAVRFTPDGAAAPLRAEHGWPADAPLVGIVGMLTRWKGQDVLLRAFAGVLRSRPEARCVIAGDEIYVTQGQTGFKSELQQLVRELGIGHAVAFTGYRTDVPALLRALDVVVHASVEPEPFGRVVAEGMACGRPVIATDAGGVPEVTGASGTSALLVPAGDVGAMSAAIERLLGDRAEAGRLAAAGRQRILSTFSIAGHVERVQSIYERVLR